MPELQRAAKTGRAVHGVPGNERIGAFSDGVFAIAITLLVVVLIELPDHLPPGGVAGLLPELAPRLLGHVITFAILGIYWIGHHNMFLHVKRHDRTLLWLNTLFLLFIATMPFLTRLIAEYGNDRTAVVCYAATLMMAGLSLELMWWYTTSGHRLVDPRLDPKLIGLWHRRILMAPAAYLLAIALAFVSITAARIIFVCIALAYIAPNPWDRVHHSQFLESTGEE